MTEPNEKERRFPVIQKIHAKVGDRTSIPWSMAEQVYEVYSYCFGTSQSLERLAERGGFGEKEIEVFLRFWKEPKEKWRESIRELYQC